MASMKKYLFALSLVLVPAAAEELRCLQHRRLDLAAPLVGRIEVGAQGGRLSFEFLYLS